MDLDVIVQLPSSGKTAVGAASDVRGLKRKHDEDFEEAQVRRRLTSS